MDANCACAIACWNYEGINAFYDMEQDAQDLEELLDPRSWVDQYYAVMDERGDLAGFFCIEHKQEVVVIGLGLRPDLTGKGWGQTFCAAGLEFAMKKCSPRAFKLTVATFNKRAISVYRKLGFKDNAVFMHETNGGQYEFLSMIKEA